MRDHNHPWNLRRSFGSQPVVCVGNQSWPEAGIAALVIPAQSSRWTIRGQGDGFWRLGDLATWRLGGGWPPGCRPAHSPPATVQAFPSPSTPTSRVSPQAALPEHTKPFQAPGTVRKSSPLLPRGIIFLKSPFPTGNSGEPQCPH